MFFVDSGFMEGIEEPPCWQLNLARFLAPFTITYSAIQALGVLFSDQIKTLHLNMVRDHVVICGLGEKAESLTSGFLELGTKVVIIEPDDENEFVRKVQDKGAYVIFGDATDKDMLLKAGIKRARYLFNVCGDDGTNAEIAITAKNICRQSNSRKKLSCYTHIVDPLLFRLLLSYSSGTEKEECFDLEFFNTYSSGTEAMLRDFPAKPRTLIVGFGRMGRALFLKIADDLVKKKAEIDNRWQFTIIDLHAKNHINTLRILRPEHHKVCNIEPIDMTVNSFSFEKADFLFDEKHNCRFDIIYICLGKDSINLSTALVLHRHLSEYEIPIIIRMNCSSGLAEIVQGSGNNNFRNLHTFGMLEHSCSLEHIFGETKKQPN